MHTTQRIGGTSHGYVWLCEGEYRWADGTPHGKLMVTVLGGLAEFERHLILSRTSEGRSRAKARGIKFGRKPKLTKHQREEARARKANGETLVDIAKSYNVSHTTISRL